MSNVHKVVVGDWSHDGHGITETYNVRVPDGIDPATCLRAGESVVGGRLEDQCVQYDEPTIDVKFLFNIFKVCNEIGVDAPFEYESVYASDDDPAKMVCSVGNYENSDEIPFDQHATGFLYITSDEYFRTWLALVNIGVVLSGRTDMVKEIPDDHGSVHHIGGYGCFVS